MSICDVCVKPGNCCKNFPVHALKVAYYPTALHVMIKLVEINYPWMPVRIDHDEDGDFWVCSCPILGDDGRCTEYEHRPEGCRLYEPGQEALWRGRFSRSICAMAVNGIGVCSELKTLTPAKSNGYGAAACPSPKDAPQAG